MHRDNVVNIVVVYYKIKGFNTNTLNLLCSY